MKFEVAVSRNPDVAQAAAEVATAIREAFNGQSVDLGFIFFSSHYAEQTQQLVDFIQQELSPRVLLGCMGEGVIGAGEEFEGSNVVTLWAAHLPQVDLLPFHVTFTEGARAFEMNGWPEELAFYSSRPTFLLLADPFSTPIEELFNQIEKSCPGAPAIGGVASGGADLGENQLILDRKVVHGGLVGVAVSGAVSIRTVVSQGCKPIGDRYVVTKANRNIIYELGGVPTLNRLQETLDSLGKEGSRHAAMALQVGVAFDEHQQRFERGDFLIRGLIGADQSTGGVAISDLVKEGQTVQFHLRDAEAASEELNHLMAKDQMDFPQAPPLGGLLFSCNARGQRFFSEPHHDVNAVQNRLGAIPLAGFFAAGEIGPVAGQNFIHGYTASVALFSEPSETF